MNQQEIGSFLKKLRVEKGLTQENLAELTGVSSRTVSRWENGKNMPDLIVLLYLTELYEVKLSEIVEGKKESGENDMEGTEKQAIQNLAMIYRQEKYETAKKINYLLGVGAIAAIGSYINAGAELNQILAGVVNAVAVSAFLINSMYIIFGFKMDSPAINIGEKAMACTYKDTLDGVGGHLVVSAAGIRFQPHYINLRKVDFACDFKDIEELKTGSHKVLRNLLIVKYKGVVHRLLLAKKDREEVLKIYREYSNKSLQN